MENQLIKGLDINPSKLAVKLCSLEHRLKNTLTVIMVKEIKIKSLSLMQANIRRNQVIINYMGFDQNITFDYLDLIASSSKIDRAKLALKGIFLLNEHIIASLLFCGKPEILFPNIRQALIFNKYDQPDLEDRFKNKEITAEIFEQNIRKWVFSSLLLHEVQHLIDFRLFEFNKILRYSLVISLIPLIPLFVNNNPELLKINIGVSILMFLSERITDIAMEYRAIKASTDEKRVAEIVKII